MRLELESFMAGSVNKVILIGNLGRDPEIRTFQNGGKVCNFSIATSENWKDRNTGERQEKTQWHNIAIFSEPLSNIAEQYLRKGSKVFIEGQLETRKWQDQSGNDRYTTEVVLPRFGGNLTLLDSRSSDAPSQYSNDDKNLSFQKESLTNDNLAVQNENIDDLDDEVPF